jgi:hypothetical protein
MKFDLWWIIIWNDFGIVIVTITKIAILHKQVPLKHCHWNMVSHMVNYICCNSYNLSNNIHTHKNMLNCNELQMVITTQKPNYKAITSHPIFHSE